MAFWGHILCSLMGGDFISIPKEVIGIATTCEDKSRAVPKVIRRGLHKHPNRVAQVEEQVLDEGNALLGVMVFPDYLSRAELQHCLPPRLGRRHASAQVLFCLEREMFGELFPQAFLGTPPSSEILEAYEEASQEFHVKSPALILKKRAMIAAFCSQSRVSAWSC